jgi:serine/threonine-protein kinase RsbW
MELSSSGRISSLKVVSDLSSLQIVMDWFDKFLDAPIPEPLWIQGQTALVEGFTNAVRHAHAQLSPAPEVEMSMVVSEQSIWIEIKDQGQGFDLEAAWRELRQQLQQENFNPLDREEHWGNLLLLKLHTDYGWHISYLQEPDGRNCLQIRHALSGEASVHS